MKSAVGGLEMHQESVIVRCLDTFDSGVVSVDARRVHGKVKGINAVTGLNRIAVVEFGVAADLKCDGFPSSLMIQDSATRGSTSPVSSLTWNRPSFICCRNMVSCRLLESSGLRVVRAARVLRLSVPRQRLRRPHPGGSGSAAAGRQNEGSRQ